MPRHVRPTRDEFKFEGDDLVHVPTGARWWLSGDRLMHRAGKLGSVLPNGDDYRPHEVEEIAEPLLKEPREKNQG